MPSLTIQPVIERKASQMESQRSPLGRWFLYTDGLAEEHLPPLAISPPIGILTSLTLFTSSYAYSSLFLETLKKFPPHPLEESFKCSTVTVLSIHEDTGRSTVRAYSTHTIMCKSMGW